MKSGVHVFVLALVVTTFALMAMSVPRAEAAETWTNCVPVGVAVYANRIHVKCASAVGNVRYFAVSTQNAQHAARMLTVISTAQVAGRTLTILYDPSDLSGAQFGCLTSDCRVMRSAGFGQ